MSAAISVSLHIYCLIVIAEPQHTVSAVKGSSVDLPCNITPPIFGDQVRLVLWYKNESFNPIYT